MDNQLEFVKFPKIRRLNSECIITEKLDGTNAQICFDIDGNMLCGSRNREITVDKDNFGFARWATENKEELFKVLGYGRHFGEWWGKKIQRGYDLDHKMFSLFDSDRWKDVDLSSVPQLSVVPELYRGEFSTDEVKNAMDLLNRLGSLATPKQYFNPEGVIIKHKNSPALFKVTFENDGGKWTVDYDAKK